MVAYHEVGHALVSALQKKAKPVQKITIVPHIGDPGLYHATCRRKNVI